MGVGGVEGSSHIEGLGADIAVVPITPQLVAALEAAAADAGAIFTKPYDDHAHVNW